MDARRQSGTDARRQTKQVNMDALYDTNWVDQTGDKVPGQSYRHTQDLTLGSILTVVANLYCMYSPFYC